MSAFVNKWVSYRDSRRGTYEYRSATRYKAVANRLFSLGLHTNDSVLDLGAGTCQFGQYLKEREWSGLYLPVDAVLDGTDLEKYTPVRSDFTVCIETLEHLHSPMKLLDAMLDKAEGVVITTPNPEAVDVISCDPTHVSVIHPKDLEERGMVVERYSWFGIPDDTLLAYRMAA